MAERSIEISILLFSFALTFSLYIDSTLSSSLSLSLYPRSALYKSHHNDYKSLTLSRLARDSARVHSITAKLDLVINGSNRTDLNTKAIQIPVISGFSKDSGEYFTRVRVGSPAMEFYMVIDTGSDIIWLQCKPCASCHNQADPVFIPARSSSYRPVQCGSNQCSSLADNNAASSCPNGNCQYNFAYGDDSITTGDLATETVSFGASYSVSNLVIGCGHDNKGLFGREAGYIGLGGGSLSLPSQINATSFSYCLVDLDSNLSSTLEFNSTRPSDSVTVHLIPNPKIKTYLYVDLVGISVNHQMLSIPPSVFQIDKRGEGGIIVDSGTTVTRLQTQAYNALRDSFVQMTQHLPSTKSDADLFDTCYNLSSWMRRTGLPSVPIVSFHFAGDKTLPLKPKNVLFPVHPKKGIFCFAFAPTNKSPSIIGNVQQQGMRVSYDLAKMLVGFSSDQC